MAQTQQKTRILLVEDHPVNQKVVSRMLDRLSCTVDLAGDGEVGVERAVAGYDLILMDCSMPRMDGFEATRRIRDLPGPVRDTPIVALTAHATAADRERCLAAGMNAWIPKPVSHDQLVAALREYTSWGGMQPAASDGILDDAVVGRLVVLGGPDDPEFFTGLVEEFGATAQEALAEARAHLKAGRLADVRRAVHRLEGASATIGAIALRATCGRVDRADGPALQAEGARWLDTAEQDVDVAVQALLLRATDGSRT